jgi:hypothetical protein
MNISCFALLLEDCAEGLIESLRTLYAAALMVSRIRRGQPIPMLDRGA